MTEPIASSIRYAVDVNRDMAATVHLGVDPQVAATIKTGADAKAAIDHILGAWGLQDGLIASRFRDHVFRQLGLAGDPGQAAPLQSRRFVSLALALQKRAGPSDADRIQFALLWAQAPAKGGARQALEKLGECEAFWKKASQGERAKIAEVLAQPAYAKKLPDVVRGYGRVLQHSLFASASAQGRANALAQPLRAARLLRELPRQRIEIPTDDQQARADVYRYVQLVSGYNTPDGKAFLTRKIHEQRATLRPDFFEEDETYRKLKQQSVWLGEIYEDVGYGSWPYAAHKLIGRRIEIDKCGMQPDRGPHCLPAKPDPTVRFIPAFGPAADAR